MQVAKHPAVSVVIPTWNGLHLLQENLPSVREACRNYSEKCGAATEIVVVDDGSQDGTVDCLGALFADVRLVRRQVNGGFAAACNSGFSQARFPLVALLNNDVRVDRDYLIFHAAHFASPKVFAVTSKVFDWDARIFTTGGRYGRFRRGFWAVYFNYDVASADASEWIDERSLLSFYAIGGFATYDREKLASVGGFNQLLSPFHWEDVDLSYRGWKRGWEIHYEPRATARHRTSATIGAHYRESTVERVSLRNRLLFHWINLHSASYLFRHLWSVVALALIRILVLDVGFYLALGSAIRRLPEVFRLRRIEKAAMKRTDVEISKLLQDFYRSAPIQLYLSQADVLQRHPESE